jgi:hypothetical protein
MGASLPTRIKACFSAMETSQFNFSFNQKLWGYAISWNGYAYRVSEFSGSTVSPFPEAWWKCEFCIVLWSSVEASDAIRRKRPGQLSRGVLLHHDNGRPHTARATQERIQAQQWELLEHPPYSPDLAPIGFHLFGPLKDHLGAKSFADETEVWKWLRQQSKVFNAMRVFTHW